ncbi:MAG: hypothetical protein ACREGK_04495 [Geminicoccales bacterium]
MAGALISREALERIIQRAAELQAGEREIGEGLTKEEVLALGKDVGIPTRYLQQALLEEQTRAVVEAPAGLWSWLTGPRTLAADRVVPGERDAIERALTHWMEDEESLQVKRRYPDRTSWEPRAGAFASIQRALGSKGRRFALATAAEVTAQVTPLEPGFCHVGLAADVRPARKRRIQGGALVLAVGALFWPALAVLFGSIALLPAAVVIPVGVLIARQHRAANERVQISLEQVLDRLERGEIRSPQALPGAHPFVRIAEEVRKVFENPSVKERHGRQH